MDYPQCGNDSHLVVGSGETKMGGHFGSGFQELESALMYDANSVVLILNELEAAGYSLRRRDPSDRRRHLVEITAAGRAAVDRAEKGRAKIEDEVLAGLSLEEREALRKLLRQVLDGLVVASPDAAKV